MPEAESPSANNLMKEHSLGVLLKRYLSKKHRKQALTVKVETICFKKGGTTGKSRPSFLRGDGTFLFIYIGKLRCIPLERKK